MKAITTNIKEQLNRVCSKVEEILALSGMMRGSFGAIYQRCGKPTCWCADTKEKGHLCMRLMWSDGKSVKTRSIRDEERQIVKDAVEQYRKFKEIRRMYQAEEEKLDKLLVEFERNTTKNNRIKMGYHER
jgi:hypothetical protein